ncbi:DNA-binding FadR family transcriptional regulator [Mycoplana sp. BE70]|uniref:FadR/GntR family transcriptional regulator n=1 Tax=Mycoplana sp. BE70 TaxID=2817775 RepID=UPI002862099E|nr:FCD domain-containing protein [Mycoplana sp. BE70]MDR6759125.1 DNA-binding FadR family transcriptional regulator [Mycoplana sp. BE70]
MKFLSSLSDASKSTPNLVARRLHEAIATGELRPGDRLPPEIELAQGFGIALMTVRVALGALRDMGLLTTVRGRNGGNFVAADVGLRLAEAARRAPLSRAELRDLTDWRRAISGEACFLAAERAGPEALTKIREAGKDFDRLLHQFPDLRFADARFHSLIAEVSGSAALLRAETEIQLALTDVILAIDKPIGSRRLTAYTHDPIIEAISHGNGNAGREAMIRHAEDTFSWVTMLL